MKTPIDYQETNSDTNKRIVLVAFTLSGASALIYQLVWIRPLQFIFGSTIYTISIIFGVFMVGLALGSIIVSRHIEKIRNLIQFYGLLQLGIGLYGVLLLNIFNFIPNIYRLIYAFNQNFYVFWLLQFALVFLTLLIPTSLMGATFPVISKFYTENKIGKAIGEVYSVNNLGAIIGSFITGFFLIPNLGIKITTILAATINIFIAILILSVYESKIIKKILPFCLIIFVVITYFGNYKIENLYSSGFVRSQFPKELLEKTEFLYHKEGLHATVSVVKDPLDGATVLLINGKGQGSTAFSDLRVNSLLSYLPILFQSNASEVLVIGLGTGTTSGHLSQLMNVTTVEIEPAILEAAQYFNILNLDVLNNKNHELIIGDGRNYLLKSKEKYDIIIPEPSDPWQSFSTFLFSQEFLELGKDHLTQQGVFVQWVPIYEMNKNDFKSFYRTFNSVFPYVVGFVNLKENEGFPVELQTTELILLGSEQELFNEQKIKDNFNKFSLESREYLKAIWINDFDDLSNLILFTSEDLRDYAGEADYITDDNAKLELSTSKNIFFTNPQEVISDIEAYLMKNKQKGQL